MKLANGKELTKVEIIRRDNLRWLADTVGTGQLGALLGYPNGTFISQMTSAKPVRRVTETTAREYEQKLTDLNLGNIFLDRPLADHEQTDFKLRWMIRQDTSGSRRKTISGEATEHAPPAQYVDQRAPDVASNKLLYRRITDDVASEPSIEELQPPYGLKGSETVAQTVIDIVEQVTQICKSERVELPLPKMTEVVSLIAQEVVQSGITHQVDYARRLIRLFR